MCDVFGSAEIVSGRRFCMNIYKSNGDSIESYLSGIACETKDTSTKKTCSGCNICLEEDKCVLRPNRVALKCGTPLSTSIPETAAVGDTFNVANMNVDTGKYHDLCIRFEFAGNILSVPGTVTLNFQIVKQCKYQAAAFPVGPVWTFSRPDAVAGESDVFMFAVCDCDVCEDECCNYSVVATVEALTVQAPVVINNAALTVMVVDNPHC